MTKVNINGTNHQVEVEHDGSDLSYVIEKAQALWDATRPTDGGTAGPAFGFGAEREHRPGWDVKALSIGERLEPRVEAGS